MGFPFILVQGIVNAQYLSLVGPCQGADFQKVIIPLFFHYLEKLSSQILQRWDEIHSGCRSMPGQDDGNQAHPNRTLVMDFLWRATAGPVPFRPRNDAHQYAQPWNGISNAVFKNDTGKMKGGLVTEAGARWYQGTNSDAGSPLTLIDWLTKLRKNPAAKFVPGVMIDWEARQAQTPEPQSKCG